MLDKEVGALNREGALNPLRTMNIAVSRKFCPAKDMSDKVS